MLSAAGIETPLRERLMERILFPENLVMQGD
jgi:hypothetical protein